MTSSLTANPPVPHAVNEASKRKHRAPSTSSPSPSARAAPSAAGPIVPDTWLASTHLRAAAIKPELWGIEQGASYLTMIDCINHDMVALGMEANILWDAVLLIGREGARACW